ncbi:MAG: hypothetical protein ACYDC3_10700 [Candidatus Binataceae bacterium]
MPSKLSTLEVAICQSLRISEAEFIRRQASEVASEARSLVREDRGLQSRYRGVELPSATGLNHAEAVACLMMNIAPADFIRTRDAGVSVNSTGAIKGRQVLDESLSQPPKKKKKGGAPAPVYPETPEDSVASLVASAMDALGTFSAQPDDPDAWMLLTQAARCLVYAIDQIAPAFADRPGAGAGA